MTKSKLASSVLLDSRPALDPLDEDQSRAIRASQISAVINLIPITASINLFNALIIVAAFWSTGQTITLVVWGGTILLAVGMSIASWLRFRKAPPTGASNRSIDRIAIHAFFLAAVWAFIPVALFPGATAVNQVLVACFVAGMMGGGPFVSPRSR